MEISSIQGSRKYELDCQYLHSCFSGNGRVNIEKLVELLTARQSQELKLICQTYNALFHQDLQHVLSNIRNNDTFANAVYLHISEPQERDAEIIRDALFGSRINLNNLIEVTCTRSSSELHSIKQAYRLRYNSNIEHDIVHKIDGSFKEILPILLISSRKYGGRADMSMAMCDAKTLYEAIVSGKFVDWKTIMFLISERNTEQIKSILVSYKQLYGHEFSEFLKSNKCGDFGKDIRIVIRAIHCPPKFFAKQLQGAFRNSNDVLEVLARIIITRLNFDIKEISDVFAAKTGCSLENFVRRKFCADKTYGLLAELLLGLLKNC